ncbi:link [Haematobia irritans]|uniref:link n=1 Tax=Haematobia irritans TaxID=7368 RepID=UPI003F5089B1
MFQKIFCLFLILKITEGRYGFVPKFFGQDSAIIVDTDKLMPPPSPPTTPSTPMQQQTNSVNFPTKLRLAPPPFPLWQHFPRYHIIPPPPPGQIISINTWSKAKFQMTKSTTTKPSTTTSTTTTTTSTTTTTTTTVKPKITSTPINNFNTKSKFGIDTVPFVTDDEFPRELLDIAQNKLGLKSLDEIPSISELGQLLGTNSPHETLNYIKKLTANEQGVALMKAYIESTDYTDNADKTYDDEEGDDDDEEIADLGDIEEPLRINDEGLVVITTADEDSNGDYEELNANDDKTEAKEEILTSSVNIKNRKTPKIIKKLKEISNAKPGLMERLVNFMHLNNLWQKKTTDRKTNKISEENNNQLNDSDDLNRMTIQGKKIEITNETQEPEISTELPILVRDPIPYNYPVPIRRANSTSTTTTPATPSEQPSSTTTSSSSLESSTVVHLNTPKMLIPHVKQLARVTKIPPKKIEDFLASKPKLLELANKVSRFPIGYDRASPLEAQVMMAVQKAIEQDEDLKKLLSSTTTLK